MSTKEYMEPESLLKGLSETIRYRRKLLKISQEDLSKNAGFARGYLSDIERGARSFSIKNLARLSNVLKTTPSALLATTEKRIKGGNIYADFRVDSHLIFALLGKSDKALVIIDTKEADFPIIYVSDSFAVISGYSGEEARGRNFSFLLRGELYQDGLKAICLAVENKTSCETTLKLYHKDGKELLSVVSTSPVLDENGEVTHVVCLYHGAPVDHGDSVEG
ncbi:MAG: helix-turn-helix domain-containing protein [Candidatus Obscuribacterales bacterium]|nr:helix-turn-helix domain-containing protein [Candidatus Obscuribacterales bacterium]